MWNSFLYCISDMYPPPCELCDCSLCPFPLNSAHSVSCAHVYSFISILKDAHAKHGRRGKEAAEFGTATGIGDSIGASGAVGCDFA